LQNISALRAARSNKNQGGDMTIVVSSRNASHKMTREKYGDLSRHELLALKEIELTGRAANSTVAVDLLNDDMIIESQDGYLQLTAKGRRMLVRGSPSLWDIVS
jgi:hypothetical protein